MINNNAAIFIDADNINAKDSKRIIYEVGKRGVIKLKRVYGDWTCPDLKPWKLAAQDDGILKIQADRIAQKNSTDIKIVVDVMKTIYTMKNIHIICIVTSDSDYAHVAETVRIEGKKLIFVGSANANNALKANCDEFIEIQSLNEENDENDLFDIFLQSVNKSHSLNTQLCEIKKYTARVKTELKPELKTQTESTLVLSKPQKQNCCIVHGPLRYKMVLTMWKEMKENGGGLQFSKLSQLLRDEYKIHKKYNYTSFKNFFLANFNMFVKSVTKQNNAIKVVKFSKKKIKALKKELATKKMPTM